MRSEERIHPAVIELMREEIADADGGEVLFVGRVDAAGMVRGVVVAARGDEFSVPALAPHTERGDVVIHNHPSGTLRPSKADLSIASELGSRGIGFYIVDSAVNRVYAVAEPVLVGERKPLDLDALAASLEPGGRLQELMDSYEPRAAQVELLRMIGETFNEEGICVAEAGTGVGKSLAYLLPALAWTSTNDERIVVSTATINLQNSSWTRTFPWSRSS